MYICSLSLLYHQLIHCLLVRIKNGCVSIQLNLDHPFNFQILIAQILLHTRNARS